MQMRQGGDDVRELMHDGCPVARVGGVPFGEVAYTDLKSRQIVH